MVGHYGTPALVAGGLSIALLVIHLAVPFAMDDYPEGADPGTETLGLKDMGDRLDAAQDQYGMASLGMIMTGLILALVGGLTVLILGLVPLPVTAARFIGWALAFIGAMGAFFAFTASLFHVGAGFTTLLGLGNGDITHTWMISPVLTAVGTGFLLVNFLKIMTNVVTRENDLRTSAANTLRVPFLAALLLAGLLVMPLSIQAISGDDRVARGDACAADGCSGIYEFWAAGGSTSGANTVGILSTAEATKDSGIEMFQGLALTIKVVIAAAWVAFFVGAFASLGHVITSATGAPMVTKVFGAFQLANLVTAPWAAIMLVLAAAYQTWKPAEKEVLDLMTGEFAWYSLFTVLVAGAAMTLLIMRLVGNLTAIFGTAQEVVEKGNAKAVSFD